MQRLVMVLTLSLLLAAGAFAGTEIVIVNFDGSNGASPESPVMLDKNTGNIYGMAWSGGTNGFGTVYQIVNSGGAWGLNILHNFTGGTSDVCKPYTNGLVMDPSGHLYGIAPYCGAYNLGGVFELSNSGGTWTEKLLYSFSGGSDGGVPYAGLAIDSRGVLYGTTTQGGSSGCGGSGCGTVFTLTNKRGAWTEKVIHVFGINPTDGINPYSPVTLSSSGNIYGTTVFGGGLQYGAVFELARQKKGGWEESILYSFFGPRDGCNPFSGVILDTSGNLYGTTPGCGSLGFGTVYQLKRSGTKYTNHVILTFNGSNGAYPYDYGTTVALDSAGNVYGTAYLGGAYGEGTVFKLAPRRGANSAWKPAPPDTEAGEDRSHPQRTWIYTDVYDFQNNSTDGGLAFSGLAIDSAGKVYGTTNEGGEFYCGAPGCGTVYQITP